jgi:hypothetical protein
MKKTILVIFVPCLFTLLVIELLLRVFFPVYLTGYVGAYRYDEQLGYRLKSSIHFLKTTDYLEEVCTNKLGTVNFQETFDKYSKLVFTIGDSYTQGTGLPSDAGYPAQLDLMLNMQNQEYRPDYGVVNLGLAAFGAEQEILSVLIYKRIIGKPAYILYLGCSNDYDDDIMFREGLRHRHLVDGNPHYSAALVKPMQWLTNDTEIGKRLKLIFPRKTGQEVKHPVMK